MFGLPFMKVEPKHFSCVSTQGDWTACTREDICAKGLTQDEYKVDTTDSQFIRNWVEQCDLLCETKPRIGFLGASYFVGVIVASSLVPVGYISDQIGRKWVFVASTLLVIGACTGLYFSTQLE